MLAAWRCVCPAPQVSVWMLGSYRLKGVSDLMKVVQVRSTARHIQQARLNLKPRLAQVQGTPTPALLTPLPGHEPLPPQVKHVPCGPPDGNGFAAVSAWLWML